jgi:hypothetical protein
MVAAIAVLFSSFTNATLAAILTLALALGGHLAREALPYWQQSAAGRALSLIVPNLASLDLKVEVVYERSIALSSLALVGTYGILYSAACLALAAAIFARRDLR